MIPFKNWLIWILRRATYKWPPRSASLKAAWVERGIYRCAKCKKVFPRKDVAIDHIVPVIDPKNGWVSWDVYIERLFCEEKGFQILCRKCHDKKTKKERSIGAKT